VKFGKAEIGMGIIGLGMGQCVFSVKSVPESTVRVRGICDTNEDRLREVAEENEVGLATADYRELLKEPGIDVVGVYTPDDLHAEHVLAALDAGKHVVCTKPMVTSLADARAILSKVRATGLKFLVGQTCRFIENYETAKSLVDQGKYGKLLYVEATYNHDLRDMFVPTPWRCQMPQDFLFGGLCHPMDLAMWIGGRITQCSAFSHKSLIDDRYPSDIDDNYVAILRFENGALGRVIGMYSFVHPDGMPYIELTVSGSKAGSWQDKVTWEAQVGQRTVEEISSHRPVQHEGADYSGHHGEVVRYLRHFEECLRNDLEPAPGALEGTRVIAALEAVRQSARTGRAVTVEWDF